MPYFRWLGHGPIAKSADLRDLGWRLCNEPEAKGGCVVMVDAAQAGFAVWRALFRGDEESLRRWTLVIGVRHDNARARLLAHGLGDVVGAGLSLREIEQRARRVASMAEAQPRWKAHGPLRLDLLAREAYLGRRPLGLYPREFALLWRLMDNPGHEVTKRDLLRDVWHLGFVPETNSLAVHASRLRAKLTVAGLHGWVQTSAEGGYFLAPLPCPTIRRLSRRPAVSNPPDYNKRSRG